MLLVCSKRVQRRQIVAEEFAQPAVLQEFRREFHCQIGFRAPVSVGSAAATVAVAPAPAVVAVPEVVAAAAAAAPAVVVVAAAGAAPVDLVAAAAAALVQLGLDEEGPNFLQASKLGFVAAVSVSDEDVGQAVALPIPLPNLAECRLHPE